MDCKIGPELICVVCGRKAWSATTRRDCRPGLGDMVAAGLSSVGITKDRVSAVVGRDCGCAERQEWLNRLGHKLGISALPTPSDSPGS